MSRKPSNRARNKSARIPSYRLHKASGQAVVSVLEDLRRRRRRHSRAFARVVNREGPRDPPLRDDLADTIKSAAAGPGGGEDQDAGGRPGEKGKTAILSIDQFGGDSVATPPSPTGWGGVAETEHPERPATMTPV